MIALLRDGLSVPRGVGALDGDGKAPYHNPPTNQYDSQHGNPYLWNRDSSDGDGKGVGIKGARALFFACPDPTDLAAALINRTVRIS